MRHSTINQERVIELFHELMQPDSSFRIWRLLGEAKLGKSHFLTKIFPTLARESRQVRCVLLDLRRQSYSPIDILHAICDQLGGETAFPAYCAAYGEWLNRPRVQTIGLKAFLARVSIRAEGQADEQQRVIRHLLSQFIADLDNFKDVSLLFLFDTINEAGENTQKWLMDSFLVQLARLTNVRVVLAGRRDLPTASGTYAAICDSYELLPVEEEAAYIDFCERIDLPLDEQSIRDFAYYVDYKPGLFVDGVVPKFMRRGVVCG